MKQESFSLVRERWGIGWWRRRPGQTLGRRAVRSSGVGGGADDVHEHLDAGRVALKGVRARALGQLAGLIDLADVSAAVTGTHAASLLVVRLHVVIQRTDVRVSRAQIAAQSTQMHLLRLQTMKHQDVLYTVYSSVQYSHDTVFRVGTDTHEYIIRVHENTPAVLGSYLNNLF